MKMTHELKRYALIGHPISHSLSPRIHNAAFQALGLKAVYELHDTALKGAHATIDELVKNGFSGFNVTMPDKRTAASLCDSLSDEARLTGSVNTVLIRDGRLFGTTTDGAGFLYAVSTLGLSLEGGRLTLLGGGGAAVSILCSAALAGTKRICVFCRSAESGRRISDLSSKLKDLTKTQIDLYSFDDISSMREAIEGSLLLANATNVGMGGDPRSPVPGPLLRPQTAVFDAIYHPSETALLKTAKETGCKTANGLPMLIGQAAAAFELWTGLPMPLSSLPSLL